jgi:hypothetical protein
MKTYTRKMLSTKAVDNGKDNMTSNVKKRWSARHAEKRLDLLWSAAIKARDGHRCLHCKRTSPIQSAHLFSRLHRSTRFDLINGVTLCNSCHIWWAHREPFAFVAWVQSWMPVEDFTLLMVRANSPASPLDPFKFELLEAGLKQAIINFEAKF